MIKDEETHSPASSNGGDDSSRNHHRLDTPRTLEQHTAERPGDHTVQRIMPPPIVTDDRVEPIVDHGDNTRRVTQERTPARN